MAWFLAQSLIFLVLAFLLGMLVGWMVWGRAGRSSAAAPETAPLASFFSPAGGNESATVIHEPEPMRLPRSSASASASAPPAAAVAVPDAALASAAEPVADPAEEPETVPDQELDEALDAEPQDDLQRIEGIGPKISSVLAASGIRTYEQLADLDRLTLTETLSAGGVKFAPSLATWAEQARLLARGDEAAFLELAGRLLSDRRAR